MASKKTPHGNPVLTGMHRLNKILAAAGLGSRRQCDELIEQERVEVDGQIVTSLGMKVDPNESKIVVDGTPLRHHRPVYYAVNKPAGVLCTNSDPQGRPRVIDLVPGSARLFPVGRLDASSIGLILLTNDGELAQRLTHPRFGVAKTYFVVVQGQVEPQELVRLRKGVYLAEGVARVEGAKIRKVRRQSTELEIVLSEGKNREIRRVLARFGHKVVVLRRLAIGPLRLGTLPEGMYRPLNSNEVAALYRATDEAKNAKKRSKGSLQDSDPKSDRERSGDGASAARGDKGTSKSGAASSKRSDDEGSQPARKGRKVDQAVASSGSATRQDENAKRSSRARHPETRNDESVADDMSLKAGMVEVRPLQIDLDDAAFSSPRRFGEIIGDDDDELVAESFEEGGDEFEEALSDDYDDDEMELGQDPDGRSRQRSDDNVNARGSGRQDRRKIKNREMPLRDGSRSGKPSSGKSSRGKFPKGKPARGPKAARSSDRGSRSRKASDPFESGKQGTRAAGKAARPKSKEGRAFPSSKGVRRKSSDQGSFTPGHASTKKGGPRRAKPPKSRRPGSFKPVKSSRGRPGRKR